MTYIRLKAGEQFIRSFVARIIGLFLPIVFVISGILPAHSSSNRSINFPDTQKRLTNQYYFITKQDFRYFITSGSSTVIKTNLILHNHVDGEGHFIITSKYSILLDANNNKIDNLVIRNTKLKLHGHLRILRKIRLSGESEIVLNDFNLILSSVVTLDNVALQKILANGTGRTVHIQDTDLLPIRNNIQHTSSTIDIHSLVAGSIITFPPMYVCSAYYFAERDFNIFREIDSPPPKKIVLS